MQLIDTQIQEEGGSRPAFRVQFTGSGGEIISIFIPQAEGLDRGNVIGRARELLGEIGAVDSDAGVAGS